LNWIQWAIPFAPSSHWVVHAALLLASSNTMLGQSAIECNPSTSAWVIEE
jgi:hypothetical protein